MGFLIRNGQESAEKFSELFPLSLLPLYLSASLANLRKIAGKFLSELGQQILSAKFAALFLQSCSPPLCFTSTC